MSTKFPDDESIGAALALATRAPSVHNTQPWRWRVGEESLQLYADPERQLTHTDPDRRQLVISCGAALHHCVVALAAMDWGTRIHRLPNAADPDHLASIEVYRSRATNSDFSLAAAISRRRTDCRLYTPWPIPRADIQLMGKRATDSGVDFHRVELVATLNDVVAEAVSRHMSDADYLNELRAWSGRHGSTDGVPARSVPVPDPSAMPPGRLFVAPTLEQPAELSGYEDAAVVVGLSTEADNTLAHLRAGEATSALMLTATSLGMASCAITEPLEITDTRARVRTEVLQTSGFPQMLARIGWALLNADPLPATPQRSLHDVVTRLDGSPFDAPTAR